VKVSFRFLTRRARRYGRACVNFGAPVSVDEWLATNPGVLDLPREERLPRLLDLAQGVMRRLAAIMPVTSVSLASTALLRHGGTRITRPEWESLLEGLRSELREAGAQVIGEDRSSGEILDRALVMLTLRRVVAPEGDGFEVDRSQDLLLRYYASSIAHFFEAGSSG
jgi:glycerol-3-phosphate O-acyltransferase